jgi:hypothetical protein
MVSSVKMYYQLSAKLGYKELLRANRSTPGRKEDKELSEKRQ